MSDKITSIKGMHDALPEQTVAWQKLESSLRQLMNSYAYEEIRMPIVEKTALFKRSIGDVTDIVQKEMYTFEDRNGDSLTLRPEGTASCVRAAIEHGMLRNQVQKLWYTGPMFRHERPQKGRYRQFSQLGVEVFGLSNPDIDVELILMGKRLWQELGIDSLVTLQINTLGTTEDREKYLLALVDYLEAHKDQLDDESRDRLTRNPMRILDSKNAEVRKVLENAPTLDDYLAEDSSQHFDKLCKTLDALDVPYEVNPQLVRGLDYYSHTVFEWVTDALGAQGTVCAGGRYDGLVSQLGGQPTPAIGFAVGLDRLLVLLEQQEGWAPEPKVDVFMMVPIEEAELPVFKLSEAIRTQLPGLSVQTHYGGGSMKSQIKKADKSGAELAIIVGQEELANNTATIKHLRKNIEQESLTIDNVPVYLSQIFYPEN